MWYSQNIGQLNNKFHLKKHIKEDFLSFCDSEVFWFPESDKLDDLTAKIKKNIFFHEDIILADHYFISFVLSYFHEKKTALTDENIIEFFSNEAFSNPTRLMLMANSYNYATVKEASRFLSEIHPETNGEMWKEYLADHQSIFSDMFFVSEAFKNILMEKKKMFRSHILNFDKIKAILATDILEYEINLKALLKTNFIITKPDSGKSIMMELINQKVIHPLMHFPDDTYISEKTIFEHTMMRPQNNVMWWLEKVLLDFQDDFNFKEMILFFEQQLIPGFYLQNFPTELKNYKEIIHLMKKIDFKLDMEKLCTQSGEDEKTTKI